MSSLGFLSQAIFLVELSLQSDKLPWEQADQRQGSDQAAQSIHVKPVLGGTQDVTGSGEAEHWSCTLLDRTHLVSTGMGV